MNELICPATRRQCPRVDICGPINEPFVDAIPSIRRELDGVSIREAGNALVDAITREADRRSSRKLHPEVDSEKNGFATRVCPGEMLDSDVGKRLGPVAIGECVTDIVETSIAATVKDIRRKRSFRTRV